LLDEQRAKLLDHAKGKALEKANAALKELKELGLHYSLTEGKIAKKPRKGVAKTGAAKRQMKDAPCPACKFQNNEPLPDFLQSERILSRRQGAELIGVSYATYCRQERAGELPPAIWLSERRRGHRVKDLLAHIEKRAR
jgi:hypothetical protein